MIWFAIIVISITIFLVYKSIKQEDKNKEWENNELNKLNIKKEDISIEIRNRNIFKSLLYLKDKRLFFIFSEKEIFKEIKIRDILKVEIETIEEHKGKQKIMALTPQYNIIEKIIGVRIKIITKEETYKVYIDGNSLFEAKEKMERLKAILEKEISEVV